MENALSAAYTAYNQQSERTYIFEQLNESLTPTLSSPCRHLNLLGQQVEESPELYCCQRQALAQQALEEIRRVMEPTVPDDSSLAEALRSLVWSFKSMGMRIDFYGDDSPPPLLLPLETTLYKLVQEILSHAHQYAPTAPVSLQLALVQTTVQLTLSFSDVLLAPLLSQSAGQAVIFSMQEWVGERGGKCIFHRKVESEAEIRANLPLLLREKD